MKLIVIWCLLIFSGVGMASFDGNGDQMDDLIWHHQSSGALYQYQLSSNHIQSIDYLATVPPEWSAWRGDFNGDGLSDLLWQHQTSGELWIYLMNNTQRLLSRRIARVGSEWQIRAVVDINGDDVTITLDGLDPTIMSYDETAKSLTITKSAILPEHAGAHPVFVKLQDS